jgi:hypothetical protein
MQNSDEKHQAGQALLRANHYSDVAWDLTYYSSKVDALVLCANAEVSTEDSSKIYLIFRAPSRIMIPTHLPPPVQFSLSASSDMPKVPVDGNHATKFVVSITCNSRTYIITCDAVKIKLASSPPGASSVQEGNLR